MNPAATEILPSSFNEFRGKKPRKMTEKRLQNIALYYSQRYVVSKAKLADYLKNRIYREVNDDVSRRDIIDFIPSVVSKLANSGYVNDEEAASAKLRSALRSGYSAEKAVFRASRASMVESEEVKGQLHAALEDNSSNFGVIDLNEPGNAVKMAMTALQRANRGPFRTGKIDEKTRRRDVSWLQRRGYSFEEIKNAMCIEDTD